MNYYYSALVYLILCILILIGIFKIKHPIISILLTVFAIYFICLFAKSVQTIRFESKAKEIRWKYVEWYNPNNMFHSKFSAYSPDNKYKVVVDGSYVLDVERGIVYVFSYK